MVLSIQNFGSGCVDGNKLINGNIEVYGGCSMNGQGNGNYESRSIVLGLNC